jgi:hypothetical protein
MQRLFILIIAILLFACQREVNIILPKSKSSSLEDFFKNNAVPLQKFTGVASNQITVTTAKGNKVEFPANAFVTLNNFPVTGNVTIEVKEILTPAEMVLNNMPTMSDGLPLESGGEFFVNVTQNNQELKLAPGKYMQMNLTRRAGVDMSRMQIFNGKDTGGAVNWIPNNNPNNFVRDTFNVIGLFADSIKWINVDKFINEPYISYTADPGNTPDIDSTQVMVHLTGRNALLRILKTTDRFFSDKMMVADATVIGICVANGEFYYGFHPVKMVNGGKLTLQFVKATEDELKQKLSTLK